MSFSASFVDNEDLSIVNIWDSSAADIATVFQDSSAKPVSVPIQTPGVRLQLLENSNLIQSIKVALG